MPAQAELVLKEYRAWEAQHGGDPAQGEARAQTAAQSMQSRTPFELNVGAHPEDITLWQKYIEMERKHGTAPRVSCIYERALKIFCLLPDLWADFASYTALTLQNAPAALPIYRRALRNVPSSAKLWAGLLGCLERAGEPSSTLDEVFMGACAAGLPDAQAMLQVAKAWCGYHLRTLPPRDDGEPIGDVPLVAALQVCQPASQPALGACPPLALIVASVQVAAARVDAYADAAASLAMEKYRARLEARHMGELDAMVKRWEAVIGATEHFDVSLWSEYIEVLRSVKELGDAEDKIPPQGTERIRSAYRRACLSGPIWLCDAWVDWEEEWGSLEHIEAAQEARCARSKTLQVQIESGCSQAIFLIVVWFAGGERGQRGQGSNGGGKEEGGSNRWQGCKSACWR